MGVYVNSGTAEDVGSWISYYEPTYDVWVAPDASLGDVIDSHLVPTYLLVGADGKVKEKLVGYKNQQQVDARVGEVFAVETSLESAASGSGL